MAATGYPTPTDPAAPFVEQLVHAISLKGIDVTVIAPRVLLSIGFATLNCIPVTGAIALKEVLTSRCTSQPFFPLEGVLQN